MKPVRIIFIAIIFCFLTGVLCGIISGCSREAGIPVAKYEVTQYEEKTVEGIEYPCTLEIDCDSATIEVYTWDRTEMKFEITRRVRGDQSREKLQKFLGDFDVHLVHESGNVRFSSRFKGSIKNPLDRNIKLTIHIPANTDTIKYSTEMGKFRAYDALSCCMEIQADAADVHINKMEGKLNLTAETCDLEVGEGRLYPGSSVKISVGSIRIKARLDPSPDYSFQTDVGNVELTLASTGELVFEASGNVEENDFADSLSGRGIKVRSGMGRVALRKK